MSVFGFLLIPILESLRLSLNSRPALPVPVLGTCRTAKSIRTMTPTRTETELSLRGSLTDEQVAELMADDMLPEYDVDYSKVKPNRPARREAVPDMVRLDADVAAVLQTAESVNTA